MIEISAPDFDLAKTLDSGQVFHWEKADGGFVGAIGDLPVYIEQTGESLKVRDGEPPSPTRSPRRIRPVADGPRLLRGIVARYFALDHPLAEICDSFPKDPVMNAARDFCRGLRIIRQPKWECLATFICSSMKQVAHIRQISLALRKRFGEATEGRQSGGLHLSFAAANCRSFGIGATRMCARLSRKEPACDGAACQLRRSGSRGVVGACPMPSFENNSARCPAWGRKSQIASCCLRMSGLRAFPIDVWIERVLTQQYFSRRKKMTAQRLRDFSESYFGQHGGYAQQYLFHHARMNSRNGSRSRDSSTPKAFGARDDK